MSDNHRLGFYSPRQFQVDLFSGLEFIFFLRSSPTYTWLINEEQIPSGKIESEDDFEVYLFILAELKKSSPIFARHFDDLTGQELYFRDLSFQILGISRVLNDLDLKFMVMGTASSHHLPTLMLEIACRCSGVVQVFEYYILNDRVLPMLQKFGVETRVPIDFEISDYSFTEDLESWMDNGWKANTVENLGDSKDKFLDALMTIIYLDLRIIFVNFMRSIFSRKFLQPVTIKKHGVMTRFRLLLRQKRALKTLEKYIAEDSISDSGTIGEQLVVLAAHFQPEATTFPDGGNRHNHIDIVAEIRSSGYSGSIYYKEHPAVKYFSFGNRSTNVGVHRSSNYYRTLRLLGCSFLPDSFEIIQSEGVLPITITGSIAFERGLALKRTVVAGYPWYGAMPGVVGLDDFLRDPSLENSTVVQSKEFRDYVLNLLNYRTFPNYFSKPLPEETADKSKFLLEYQNFIKKLTCCEDYQMVNPPSKI
jgi:hypothetical protein